MRKHGVVALLMMVMGLGVNLPARFGQGQERRHRATFDRKSRR